MRVSSPDGAPGDVRAGLGGHAIGLSVIVFNPIPYLIILAAYGVAYWIVIVRKRVKPL
jgi:hypothetical protein